MYCLYSKPPTYTFYWKESVYSIAYSEMSFRDVLTPRPPSLPNGDRLARILYSRLLWTAGIMMLRPRARIMQNAHWHHLFPPSFFILFIYLIFVFGGMDFWFSTCIHYFVMIEHASVLYSFWMVHALYTIQGRQRDYEGVVEGPQQSKFICGFKTI